MAKSEVSIQAPFGFGLDLKENEKRVWVWIQTKPSSLALNSQQIHDEELRLHSNDYSEN
jgi:hypothetical protein